MNSARQTASILLLISLLSFMLAYFFSERFPEVNNRRYLLSTLCWCFGVFLLWVIYAGRSDWLL